MSGRRLKLALVLTVVFVAGEALVGWRIGSLALLSDAGHNLSDGLALALSAFAVWIAGKPATEYRTYGYHRVAILVALINAVSLALMAILFMVEAVRRLREPEPISGLWMVLTALAAMVVNVVISLWLREGARHDLNIKSAYLHMVWDAVASAGVVVGGLLILWTGNPIADPVVSLVISALILHSSSGIIREAFHILIEGTPRSVDLTQLRSDILSVPGVLDCHDLHVWTISSGILAASVHLVVEEQSVREAQAVAQRVSELMDKRYQVGHSTIQVEVDHCGRSDLLCTLTRQRPSETPSVASTATESQ